MKFITDVESANTLLQEYKGASLNILTYSRSLKRIVLTLKLLYQDMIINVVGVGCEYINCKFSIPSVELVITEFEAEHNVIFTKIKDTNGNFELITSGGFSIAQGQDSEFGTSFENLILKKEEDN